MSVAFAWIQLPEPNHCCCPRDQYAGDRQTDRQFSLQTACNASREALGLNQTGFRKLIVGSKKTT